VRALHGPGGARREDSSLHLLATESFDDQRPGTVKRTHHRDSGIPAGKDDPACLPELSVPGRMRGKTRPAGQSRSARPFLPIRARTEHHHRVGAGERAGSPQGWIGVYDDCIGSVSQIWSRWPPQRPLLEWGPYRDVRWVLAALWRLSQNRQVRSPGGARRVAVAIGLGHAIAVNRV
jgi:hypothetical protein